MDLSLSLVLVAGAVMSLALGFALALGLTGRLASKRSGRFPGGSAVRVGVTLVVGSIASLALMALYIMFIWPPHILSLS